MPYTHYKSADTNFIIQPGTNPCLSESCFFLFRQTCFQYTECSPQIPCLYQLQDTANHRKNETYFLFSSYSHFNISMYSSKVIPSLRRIRNFLPVFGPSLIIHVDYYRNFRYSIFRLLQQSVQTGPLASEKLQPQFSFAPSLTLRNGDSHVPTRLLYPRKHKSPGQTPGILLLSS